MNGIAITKRVKHCKDPQTTLEKVAYTKKGWKLKKVNQLLHKDIFTKRFKQACYIIMYKDEKIKKIMNINNICIFFKINF